MAYDTTEAVAKFLSGFQMKITNRERDTVAPEKDDRDACRHRQSLEMCMETGEGKAPPVFC